MSELISGKIVKIRKMQKCWGCAGVFMPGTRLQRVVSADSGEIITSYWCPVCQAYWSEYMHTEDEINIGELKSEDPDGWNAIAERLVAPAAEGGK